MTEDIKQILSKIDELEKFKKDSQKTILTYCKDKSIPLEERWKIWERYSSKVEEYYIMDESDFNHPLLKYLCKLINEGDNDRGREISYYNFINNVEWFDSGYYEEIPSLIRDFKINLILDDKNYDPLDSETINNYLIIILKEALIEENFGSYSFDW